MQRASQFLIFVPCVKTFYFWNVRAQDPPVPPSYKYIFVMLNKRLRQLSLNCLACNHLLFIVQFIKLKFNNCNVKIKNIKKMFPWDKDDLWETGSKSLGNRKKTYERSEKERHGMTHPICLRPNFKSI